MTFYLASFLNSSSVGHREIVFGYLSCLDSGITENDEVAKTLGYGDIHCGNIFEYLLKNQLVSKEGAITSEGRKLFLILQDEASPEYLMKLSESLEQLKPEKTAIRK